MQTITVFVATPAKERPKHLDPFTAELVSRVVYSAQRKPRA